MQINKLFCSLAVLLIFLSGKGTVFQTDVSFKSIVPRLRPGLLSLRSVLSSRQICCLVALVPCCFVVTSCNIVNQLNNKTTKPSSPQQWGLRGFLCFRELSQVFQILTTFIDASSMEVNSKRWFASSSNILSATILRTSFFIQTPS